MDAIDRSPYSDKLRKSKQQLEKGKGLVTFTMEELESYTNKTGGKTAQGKSPNQAAGPLISRVN